MKRWIAVILICILTIIAIPASAAFTDVAGTGCEEAAEVLSSLGIVNGKNDESTFMPADTLTRAETAAILTRLSGVGAAENVELPFSDVPKTHWAYGEIGAAYTMGIMKGMDEENFAPDAPVTYQQAVKIAVATLGYSVQAESMGGYPSGYLVVAAHRELLQGVKVETNMTRGNLANLFYNVIDASPMVKAGYGTAADGEYTVLENETYLSYTRNIYTTKGRVEGVYGKSLTMHGYALKQGEAVIGGQLYKNCNGTAYLGYEVKVYYTEADDEYNALCIVPSSGNTLIRISRDEISSKTTKTMLIYEAAGKEERTGIATDALLSKNGKPKKPWSVTDLFPEKGSLTCILNQRGEIDAILAEETDVYVVDSVDINEGAIFLMKNDKSKTLLQTTAEYKTVLMQEADGTPIALENLKKWDVLTVSAVDSETITIVRSNKSVEGTVTELSNEYAMIGGAEYKIRLGMTEKISVGTGGTFYLSCDDEISALDRTSQKRGKYGYLVGATQKSGLDSDAQIKIFSEDSQMHVFTISDYVRLNDENEHKNSFMTKLPKEADGTVKRQLVRYETDEEGTKLLSLALATDNLVQNTSGVDALGWGQAHFTRDYYIDTEGLTNDIEVGYKGGFLRMFAGRMMLTADTKIFVIPKRDAQDKEYKMMAYTDLLHDEHTDSKYADISLFDVDSYGVVSAMVWDFGNLGSAAELYPLNTHTQAIIKSVSTIYSEDTGEAHLNLNIFTANQKELSIPIESDTEAFFKAALTTETKRTNPGSTSLVMDQKMKAADLRAGDVIQYSMQGDSLEVLNVLFRAETPGYWDQYWGIFTKEWQPYYGNAERSHGSLYTGFGTVKRVGPQTIVAEVLDKNDPSKKYTRTYTTFTNASSSILSYDMKTQKLKMILPGEILPGDKIFVSTQSTNPRFIICYKNMD